MCTSYIYLLLLQYDIEDLHFGDTKKEVGKHKVQWGKKELKVTPCPFTHTAFNDVSLRRNLPGYPERMSTPKECHNFFFTDDMWQLGLDECNQYPKYLASSRERPPFLAKNLTWPPKWTQNPVTFTMEEYQLHMMILHVFGLKKLGTTDLRAMFSNDPMYCVPLAKQLTTRRKMEAFLRQLHFEDSACPCGRYDHSVNYRPHGVPKVGLFMHHFNRRCILFCPERDLSFDEATAKYGGRMTHLKHLQSKYKPYDGIR